jgi:hypothetical protein
MAGSSVILSIKKYYYTKNVKLKKMTLGIVFTRFISSAVAVAVGHYLSLTFLLDSRVPLT